MKRRVGIIRISNTLYEQDWDDISKVFSRFKPEKIKKTEDNWFFQGTSDEFLEIDESDTIPIYIVIFNTIITTGVDACKVTTFKFEKEIN